MESVPSIIFPHLGIEIGYFPNNFTLFGSFTIAFYGIILALGMILAVWLSIRRAKQTNQSVDDYVDIAILCIIFGIIGGRLYYVLFSLDYYIANPAEIFNIRGGGMAIYGAIIGGIISTAIVCKVKKIRFFRVMDTAVAGIVIAQALGRWANFVNREAFGEYTDGLFAMQIRYSEVNPDCVTELMKQNMVTLNGVDYVQVAPTFLYESIWCLVVFILIMIFKKYQRYTGEVSLWYIGGYGLGRVWIEGLRTDALYIGHTNIPVSQLLSLVMVVGAFLILLINRIRLIRKTWTPDFHLVLPEGAPGTQTYAEARKAARKAKKAAEYKEKHGEEKKNASEWETYTVKKDAAEEAAAEAEEAAAAETAEAETAEAEPDADNEAVNETAEAEAADADISDAETAESEPDAASAEAAAQKNTEE